MAWPEDAVDVTYSANQTVPSDNLNEIQERIVDLHRQHTILLREAEYQESTGVAEWEPHSDHEKGWECKSAGVIAFPVTGLRTANNPVRISRVRLKVYNGGTASMQADLYKMDMQFDAAATAPAGGASLATDTATVDTSWEVLELAPVSEIELTADALVLVRVSSAAVGDLIAAVEVTLKPIKPTP